MISPEESTLNWEVEPTERREAGAVVPMPTFPPGIKAKSVVPPVWICLAPVEEEKFKMAEAPSIITEVALGKEIAAFLIEAVPEVAPIVKEVAAPAKFKVVAVVLKRVRFP